MKKNSTEEVYASHHKKGERYGSSILERERGRLLREHIGESKNILDIGCRDGVLTKEFAENNSVLGIDIDSAALQEAKESLHIEVRQVDLNSSWGLEENSFDVVVAGEVLEHLYFPKDVIRKASEVLKKPGLLIGSVPNAFSLKNRIRLFFGEKGSTPLSDPTHINHFHSSELKGLLEENFDEVEILPLGKWAKFDFLFPGMFSFDLFFVARGKK